MKKNIVIYIVSLAVVFWLGMVYEKINRHRQELLMFANFFGDEITNTNALLSSMLAEPTSKIIFDYNNAVLQDIGCSVWLKYLDYFESSDLESFKIGLALAAQKIEENDLVIDDSCIRKALDWQES